MLEPGQMTCPACGLDRQTRKVDVHYIDGQLVEFGQRRESDGSTRWQSKKSWYRAFVWKAQHSMKKDGTPYSIGWAAHTWRDKFKTDRMAVACVAAGGTTSSERGAE